MAIDDNTSYELTGAQVKDLASKINAKADTSSLATVATSGAYSDLTGTPTIPTVNDATLTITQNGTSAGTFTANASSNATIALTDTTYSAGTGISIDQNNAIGIDTTSVIAYEKIYDYEVTSGSSSDIAVYVPTDFNTYQQIIVEMTLESGYNAGNNWNHMSACNSSKTELSTDQDGIEMSDSSSITGIHRTNTQLIGYGTNNSASCCAKVTLYAVATNNYPTYFADGFGGSRRSEILHGRVTTGAADIKYVKVQLARPKVHSRVWAYGLRRPS